jgi:site-specific DNA recombinase
VFRFYKCQGRFKFGICDVQTIAEESIEKEFLSLLSYDDPDLNIETKLGKDEALIDNEIIDKQLAKLENKKGRLKELYLEGDIPKSEYKKKMKEYNDQEIEFNNMKSNQEEQASAEMVKSIMLNIKNEWGNLSFEAKKKAVHTLFDSMTIKLIEPTKPGKYPKPPIIEITDHKFKS